MEMKRQEIKTGYKIRDKRYGFTIVEMLLVVVVIALIAGASGGIWLGTYKNMLARKSAREFLLAAKYARILAIERQSPCRIILDAENNKFWLVINEFSERLREERPNCSICDYCKTEKRVKRACPAIS